MSKAVWTHLWLLVVIVPLVIPNIRSGLAAASGGSPVRRRASGNAKGEDAAPPDPDIALSGECLVVCDADVVGLKPVAKDSSTGQSNAQNTAGSGPSIGGRTNLWGKTPFGVPDLCNGLVGVGRRGRRIAFSAMRNNIMGNPESALNSRETVTFDYVLVNVGNAFDLEKSTFVAPVSGVYSLSFQVYRLFNKNPLTVVIKVNNMIQFSGFANGNSGNYEAAHNSGLLHLRQGDRVYVQVTNGNLDGGWKFSTFSGYLIFEDDDI